MRRLSVLLGLLALAGCTAPPVIHWPPGPAAPTPPFLPASQLTPPPANPDPGPALDARAGSLRRQVGL